MKPRLPQLFALFLFIVPIVGSAEDFAMLDGTTYTNATVMRVEPDGIVLRHSKGIAKMLFANLPPETQKKYNYDPQKAAEYSQRSQQTQAESQRRQAAAAQQRAKQIAEQDARGEAEVNERKETDEARRKLLASSIGVNLEIRQVAEGGSITVPYVRKKLPGQGGKRAQYKKEYKTRSTLSRVFQATWSMVTNGRGQSGKWEPTSTTRLTAQCVLSDVTRS